MLGNTSAQKDVVGAPLQAGDAMYLTTSGGQKIADTTAGEGGSSNQGDLKDVLGAPQQTADVKLGNRSGDEEVDETATRGTGASFKGNAKDGVDVPLAANIAGSATRHDKQDAKGTKTNSRGTRSGKGESSGVQKRNQTKKKLTTTMCVGTNVSSWFLNKEAYVNSSLGEVVKLRQQWAIENRDDARILKMGWDEDGAWYNGKVTKIIRNKFNVHVYTCTFLTPDRDKLDLTYAETKKMLRAFQELKAYRKEKQAAGLQDTKQADVTSTSTLEEKDDANSEPRFDGNDAASSERDNDTNGPQDASEIIPKTEGGKGFQPTYIPPKVKTIEEMALEVEKLTRQVSSLTRIYAAPMGRL
jgi:hypothetical protein